MTNKDSSISQIGGTKYVLSAIEKDGRRGFYAIDQHSGGYPYWSPYLHMARLVDSVDKLDPLHTDNYMRNGVTSIEVLKLVTTATVVTTEEIESEARAKAMKEIAEIEQKLREKTAELRRLK